VKAQPASKVAVGGLLEDFRSLEDGRRRLGLLLFPCPEIIVFLQKCFHNPIAARSWMRIVVVRRFGCANGMIGGTEDGLRPVPGPCLLAQGQARLVEEATPQYARDGGC
jgi:hypothetical protein